MIFQRERELSPTSLFGVPLFCFVLFVMGDWTLPPIEENFLFYQMTQAAGAEVVYSQLWKNDPLSQEKYMSWLGK